MCTEKHCQQGLPVLLLPSEALTCFSSLLQTHSYLEAIWSILNKCWTFPLKKVNFSKPKKGILLEVTAQWGMDDEINWECHMLVPQCNEPAFYCIVQWCLEVLSCCWSLNPQQTLLMTLTPVRGCPCQHSQQIALHRSSWSVPWAYANSVYVKWAALVFI